MFPSTKTKQNIFMNERKLKSIKNVIFGLKKTTNLSRTLLKDTKSADDLLRHALALAANLKILQ